MAKADVTAHIRGTAFIDDKGEIQFHSGLASDLRVRTMLSDPAWMAETSQRRLRIIALGEESHSLIVSPVSSGGKLAVIFSGSDQIVLRFFLSVDFAFDIIDYLLRDPFDAMAVIDANARLVFVSPVHEKFFGLRPGEGVGRNVRDVIENTRLHHVVKTGVAEIGHIQRMNGRERVVSRHPIRHDGKVVGAIGRVMFKGPQQVEELARRINVLEREIETYKNEAKANQRGEGFVDAIVGNSSAVRRLRDQIRKVAPLDIPVLIQGESGTGKELVAQALHMMSPRRDERLVTVNAAALPAQLVESELFGYEAGSFTGADRKGRAGKFEQAHKGTIFLDEIGDMPLEVQSKLLRVLQDRIVERVGGDAPKRVDFRLCSATNRDLEKFIEEGRFRLDLFYRICPFVIKMPTLMERIEDIPMLLTQFVADLAKQYSKPVLEADTDVHEYLMQRDWPGNIRELRHVVERAFVFCEGERLRVSDFLDADTISTTPARPVPGRASDELAGTMRQSLDQYERELMADAMIKFNGNKKKVAEHLGVSRSYLYKKLGD